MNRLNRLRKQQRRKSILTTLGYVLVLGLITVGLFFAAARAIDSSIDNRNVMNCKSAQKSLNQKYLKLCAEYYQTGDIIYMRGTK